MALNPPCPILIVKNKTGLRSKTPHGKLRVAVCSDGSEKSIAALNFMTRLIDRSRGDQLFVICVQTSKVDPERVSDAVNHGFSAFD
jgi:hypothetical protein